MLVEYGVHKMNRNFTATFDGKVLVPDEPINLEQGTKYEFSFVEPEVETVTDNISETLSTNNEAEFYIVEVDGKEYQIQKGSVFDILWNMRGTVKGAPAEWSTVQDYKDAPAGEKDKKRGVALDILFKNAGTLKGMPSDWSSQHDHYLYGTPKREDENEVTDK
jgi:hypothetical protein